MTLIRPGCTSPFSLSHALRAIRREKAGLLPVGSPVRAHVCVQACAGRAGEFAASRVGLRAGLPELGREKGRSRVKYARKFLFFYNWTIIQFFDVPKFWADLSKNTNRKN
jgi:hypothetical protein